uniref:Uncharacterized protein n=1 Tax=Arundo donax TaxID=35708 RepID=A0A0A9ETH6_ARUDO
MSIKLHEISFCTYCQKERNRTISR